MDGVGDTVPQWWKMEQTGEPKQLDNELSSILLAHQSAYPPPRNLDALLTIWRDFQLKTSCLIRYTRDEALVAFDQWFEVQIEPQLWQAFLVARALFA